MKNKIKLILAASLLSVAAASAQTGGVGVGTTTPDASSALDVTSTTKGFLMPRMTTTERTAITSPATGLQVYDTDTNTQWYYNGTAWVNAATAGAEWTYNGTDAIEATRALANGNTISVLNSGRTFLNQGNFNHVTVMQPDGVSTQYSSNPKDVYPNASLRTSDIFSLTSPVNGTNAVYPFSISDNVVKNDHVSSNASANAEYYGNLNLVKINDVTSNKSYSYFGERNFLSTNSGSTANFTGLFGSQSNAYHYGSGTVTTLSGIAVNSRSYLGNVTTLNGATVSSQSMTTTTGNITNLYGVNTSTTHNGTGAVTNLRAITSNSNIGASAAIPSRTIGLYTQASNASTTTGGASSFLLGSEIRTSNSGAASFDTLLGILLNGSTTAATGAFTHGGGIASTFTYGSNTGSTNNLYAFNSVINHNGASSIVNLFGQFLDFNFGATSSGTVTNFYGSRIRQTKNAASTTTITNNYGLFIENIQGGVTNNFSIYSNGGNVYLKDNVGIGTTTPTSKLQVVGLPVHVDNAAAVTAGLTAGAFYHSGDGIVRVVY